MTKIPSVEETSRHFCNGIALQLKPSNEAMQVIRLLNKDLPKALTDQRTALLNELRDSELLEEDKDIGGSDIKYHFRNGQNSKAKAIKAHLDELINSTK